MKVAVVGATGLVGTKMLQVLAERNFPVTELIPVASARSAGKEVMFKGKAYKVVGMEEGIAAKPAVAIFSADKFDWSTYIHNTTDYEAFMEKLVQLDGKLDDWRHYYKFYRQLPYPSEYLTNCDGSHPTIKGYKVIADELATFIKYKGYA